MKAHKYWSIGAIVTMVGTFYTGYKGLKAAHKYFQMKDERLHSTVCSIWICVSYLPHVSCDPFNLK